jgi:16S rRNA (adenine1518-N6/adenine1519-N6)-dimethyltransferase
MTTQAFNQRRKTVRNSLGDLFTPEQTDANWVWIRSLRAENISVAQFCKLANWLSANPAPQQQNLRSSDHA